MENQPISLKPLFNPTTEDLVFYYNSAEYSIKAGEKKEFVDYVAEHGAKKLADRCIMTTNPDEHQVLMQCYLENSSPEIVAQRLGVNLDKIRKAAMIEKNKEARQVNLEAQVQELSNKVAELTQSQVEKKEEIKTEEKIKKVFICKMCGKEFNDPLALARHIKAEHPKEK